MAPALIDSRQSIRLPNGIMLERIVQKRIASVVSLNVYFHVGVDMAIAARRSMHFIAFFGDLLIDV